MIIGLSSPPVASDSECGSSSSIGTNGGGCTIGKDSKFLSTVRKPVCTV